MSALICSPAALSAWSQASAVDGGASAGLRQQAGDRLEAGAGRLAAWLGQRRAHLVADPPGSGDLVVDAAQSLLDLAVGRVGDTDLLPHPLQLTVQPRQFGRRRFKLALLGLQLLGPVDHGLPIDVGELAGLVQAGQHLAAVDRGVACVLVSSLLFFDPGELSCQRRGLPEQGLELALVGPAEYVLAAVVDAVPVVLLVPAAVPFELTGLGDRLGRTPELGHRLHALEVGPPGELALQPGCERMVPDVQLRSQRTG